VDLSVFGLTYNVFDKHHICTPVDTRFSSFAYATHAHVKNVRARLGMASVCN